MVNIGNAGKIPSPPNRTHTGYPRRQQGRRRTINNVYYVTPPVEVAPKKSSCGCSKMSMTHKGLMGLMGFLSMYALYCLFGGKK